MEENFNDYFYQELNLIQDQEIILAYARSENNIFRNCNLDITDKAFELTLVSINPEMILQIDYSLRKNIELIIAYNKHFMVNPCVFLKKNGFDEFKVIHNPRILQITSFSNEYKDRLSQRCRQEAFSENLRESLKYQKWNGVYHFLKKMTPTHAKRIILEKLHDLNLFFHINKQYRRNRHIMMSFFVKYDEAMKWCWSEKIVKKCVL